MEKPLESSDKYNVQIIEENKNSTYINEYDENQSIYNSNINYKNPSSNNNENFEKKKQSVNESNEVENGIENDANKNLQGNFNNEIEVIVNNVNNNYRKDNQFNSNSRHQGGSFKRYENYDNYLNNSDSKSNYGNLPSIYSNSNYFNHQTNVTNSNYGNSHLTNYRTGNSSYFKNSLKSKNKSHLKEINNYGNTHQTNLNCQTNNNIGMNVMNINNNNGNQNNQNVNSNPLNTNFVTQVNNLLFKKKKQNFNKIKSKKISKQNHFVLSYDKTNDFTFYKSFFNLNLKFLKQNYKIRDLNLIDYEIENLKNDKNKKSKKKNSMNENTNLNFMMGNLSNVENDTHNFNNYLQSQYMMMNQLQAQSQIQNLSNSINNDKENIRINNMPNVETNKNSRNIYSSTEEIPNISFINPYFFNNLSQAQALFNYNALNQNSKILNQNGNLKNINVFQNNEVNYLSDENINYDVFNNKNSNFPNGKLNFNIPLENPLNSIRLSNQMNMNSNNYYESLNLQPYTFVNDPKIIEENIMNGRYLTGVIRINKCHTHGYITVAGLFNDILIRGNRNLNQSLHLDEVVVELFPMMCWKPLFNKKMKKISYNVNNEDKQNYINLLQANGMSAINNGKVVIDKIKNNMVKDEKKKKKKEDKKFGTPKNIQKNFNSDENGANELTLEKKKKKELSESNKKEKNEINQEENHTLISNDAKVMGIHRKDFQVIKNTEINSEELISKQEKSERDYNCPIETDSSDELSDTDREEEGESENEEILGNNNNYNYYTDLDKDDDYFQPNPLTGSKNNFNNEMTDLNYHGFNSEYKENFKTLEERLIYINQLCNLRPEGRIVKIVRSQNIDKNQIVKIINDKSLIFACPIDENIPKIFIKMKKFRRMEFLRKLENDHIFRNKYFLVKIVGWALNFKCPKGIIINELGNSGDIEVETEVLLRTYEVDYSAEYPQQAHEEISKYENWKIPEKIIKERHDLRHEIIYTIDPKHSKDLDDAISCKIIDEEKGLLEVGVHIADPSYFILKDSLIDKEALNRTTTVYLVHKNIPMLPRILSENVISLLPYQDRLAFSCTFRIYLDGALDTNYTPIFYLSVINSAAKWNYELAQRILNDEDVKFDELSEENGTKPKSPEVFQKLCESLKILHKLTKLVRSQRIESGSLIIENDELGFDLSDDLKPINFHLKKKLDTNHLIEELMLIANKLSAEFIYDNIKDLALIRKHPLLNDSKFQEIQRYLTINKMNVDFEDTQALNEMLFKLEKKDKNKYICVQHKLKNFMQRAEYTITKDKDISELRHSALNFDLYTHFTSPIRRYPDMVVHRQLKYILNKLNLLKINYKIEKENEEIYFSKNIIENNQDEASVKIPQSKNAEENHEFEENIQKVAKLHFNSFIADTDSNEKNKGLFSNSESFMNLVISNAIKKIKVENILGKSHENKEQSDTDHLLSKEETKSINLEGVKKNIEIIDEYEFEHVINYEKYIDHFNDKYYNGKMISSKSQKLFQCIFLKNIPNELYTALIVDISNKVPTKNKRGLQIANFETQTLVISLFIPKLNLEMDWKKDDNFNIINYKFNTEISVSIDYKDEEDQNIHNKILKTFDEIKITVTPIDSIPIDIKCTLIFS